MAHHYMTFALPKQPYSLNSSRLPGGINSPLSIASKTFETCCGGNSSFSILYPKEDLLLGLLLSQKYIAAVLGSFEEFLQ